MAQSLADLESTLSRKADNFELIGKFTEAHRFKKVSKGVGRLDLLVDQGAEGKWMTFCTASLISHQIL